MKSHVACKVLEDIHDLLTHTGNVSCNIIFDAALNMSYLKVQILQITTTSIISLICKCIQIVIDAH